MKTKLVAVIALIFCAFMAEASKVEGNGNIITKEISVDNYSEIELGGNIEYSGNNFWGCSGISAPVLRCCLPRRFCAAFSAK